MGWCSGVYSAVRGMIVTATCMCWCSGVYSAVKGMIVTATCMCWCSGVYSAVRGMIDACAAVKHSHSHYMHGRSASL